MIVGGTIDVKSKEFMFAASTEKFGLELAGRLGGKSGKKKKPLDISVRVGDSQTVLGSIPGLEPLIRSALPLSPLLGSMLHLHQITFAVAYLTNPYVQTALEDLTAGLDASLGHPLETPEQEFQRVTGIELAH